jgi:hypothetical protein
LASDTKSVENIQQALNSQLVRNQALDAIAQFVDHQTVDSALSESLPTVTAQLSQYQQQLASNTNSIENVQQARNQAVDAIAQFVDHQAVDSALVEALPTVTAQLSQYQQQLASDTNSVENREQALNSQLARNQAIDAIATHTERQQIQSSPVIATVADVIQQLKTLPKQQLAPEQVQQTLTAIALFVEQQATQITLAKTLPSVVRQLSLSQQQLDSDTHKVKKTLDDKLEKKYKKQIDLLDDRGFVNLVNYVVSYFQEHSETKTDKQTQGLLIVRKILRQMKDELLNQPKQEPKLRL